MSASPTDRCYWIESAQSGHCHAALSGEITVDVAIVGGGIVGTIAARALKDGGHSGSNLGLPVPWLAVRDRRAGYAWARHGSATGRQSG